MHPASTRSHRTTYRRAGKRALDLSLALLAAPILGGVTLVVGPLIKLEDGGSIFYAAPRRGYHGEVFRMYKFRTMYENAPDIRNPDGSTLNSRDDPRVTRVGRLLRKTSVDELPQILNVLKGEMSFVGPRPNLATTPFSELTPLEKQRLAVRPGITGLSQAYHRNGIAPNEAYVLDVRYVENLSLSLDLRILAKTVVSVVQRANIYRQRG